MSDTEYPKRCSCGTTCNTELEWMVHRTETHQTPQGGLNYLEPGEFERQVEQATSLADLTTRLPWSPTRTLRILGLYDLADHLGPTNPDTLERETS